MSTGAGRQLLAARNENITIYSGGFIGGWDTETHGEGAVNSSQTTISYDNGNDSGSGVCATLPFPGVSGSVSLSQCRTSLDALYMYTGFIGLCSAH